MNTRTIKEAPAQRNATAAILQPGNGPAPGPGSIARGFALAQEFIATIRNHSATLQRITVELFNVDDAARRECVRYLREWQKECRENAKQQKGMTEKQWLRLAASATTRASQVMRVIKAMRAGMTVETVEKGLRQKIEDVSFDTLVGFSRNYGASSAAGRPADAGFVKLLKYAAKLEGLDEDDTNHLIAARDLLAKMASKFGIELPKDKPKDEPKDKPKDKPKRGRKPAA